MRGPLQFDGKEIERWADDPSAAYELPRLVRRLLRASTKLRALEMGAGSAGNLGGWDGLCEAREPSTFCPGGRSGWELSTEKGVKKKLDGDFEKRVKDPAPLDGAASYVAVTARRWTKKQNWVSARTREGHWNEVRLLDADDLAHWLEECPAVAAWFASTQLGRPSETFVTLDRGLERWSRATAPWLPPRLLLAGRETQAAAIAEWSQRSTPSWLRVVGPTRGEAAMFVAAALQQLGEDVADRALLVDTATGWRWIVQQTTDQPLILVPNFDEFEPDLGTGMHWVVQTLDPNANIHNLRDVVRIDEPQPWHAFGRELRKLGLSETDAVIQSEQSRGRLQELRRNLGLVENSLPDWARRADREALLAMLLIGAWNPKHDGDRSTIEKLGVQAERLERLCADLMTSPEAPILRRDGAYEWGSAVGAWKRLADWVTDGDHTQLQVIAQDVLGEDDPSYELPADSRFMASISGKSLTRSEALRSGVANSLLQASRTSPRGRDVAIAVVRACLSTNWRHWASLRDLLPTLAEAAPDSFLDCVEASLNAPEGVIELFAQEGPPALGGSTPHVGLLWALELLAWEPQRMPRATDALARLACADPARSDTTTPRVGNRPHPSLAAVFHLVTPQTLADDNERNRTLDALTRRYPEVGFELLMSLLDACRRPSILPQSNRPAHDNRVPVSPDTPAENTVDTRKRKYLDLAVDRAENHTSRWAALIQFPLHQVFGDDIAHEVLHAIPRDDASATLWATVRGQLNLLYLTKLHQKDNLAKRLEDLHELYARLCPADILLRSAWLFESAMSWPFGPRPEGTEQFLSALDAKRDEALADILVQRDAMELIEALVTQLSDKRELGRALARSTQADAYVQSLVLATPPPGLRSLAVPFAAGLFYQAKRDYDVLMRVLTTWSTAGRHDDACSLALSVWPEPKVWDIIDKLGDPLRMNYWSSVPLLGDHDEAQWERAVANLLAAQNALTALRTASYRCKVISTQTLINVLHLFMTIEEMPHGTLYDIVEIFQEFDRRHDASKLDEQAVAGITQLEILYIGCFGRDVGREPKFVERELERSPETFLFLIDALYRTDDDPADAEISADARRLASNAYTVLDAWNGFPGQELESPRAWEPLLYDWCQAVLEGARSRNRLIGAQIEIAKILARPRAAADGLWPCLAARRLLESRAYPNLSLDLRIAKRNLRGMTIRGPYEGGAQERALALQFRTTADALRPEFPVTAALSYELADTYEREANDEDRSAREERLHDGVELGSPSYEDEPTMNREPIPDPITRLTKLEIDRVGPFEALELPFAPRINILAGDNSLGKTFVLDVAWWVLTGTWALEVAAPTAVQREHEPAIRHVDEHDCVSTSSADRVNGEWSRYVLATEPDGTPVKKGWPIADALVLYAQVDGGFSVWDRVRNTPETLPIYRFTPSEAWHGLGNNGELCRGLLIDWRDWERDDDPRMFQALCAVMNELSEPEIGFAPRGYTRLRRTGAKPIPLLALSYGEVPLVHMSAAWKRILTLAYLLVWSYHEHRDEAQRQGAPPSRSLVLLIDEVETHLHPRWQRVMLPALLTAAKALGDIELQLVVTTHSPMVMTSIEVDFDPERDAVFHFEREGDVVQVEEFSWAKFGDANAWLRSLFGLTEPTSPRAELVLQAVTDFIHGDLDKLPLELNTLEKIDAELRRSVAETHPVWVRWIIFRDARAKAGVG